MAIIFVAAVGVLVMFSANWAIWDYYNEES